MANLLAATASLANQCAEILYDQPFPFSGLHVFFTMPSHVDTALRPMVQRLWGRTPLIVLVWPDEYHFQCLTTIHTPIPFLEVRFLLFGLRLETASLFLATPSCPATTRRTQAQPRKRNMWGNTMNSGKRQIYVLSVSFLRCLFKPHFWCESF